MEVEVEVEVLVEVVVVGGRVDEESLRTSVVVGGLAKSAKVKTGGSESPLEHAPSRMAKRSSDLRIV